jgi:hypothetical protein
MAALPQSSQCQSQQWAGEPRVRSPVLGIPMSSSHSPELAASQGKHERDACTVPIVLYVYRGPRSLGLIPEAGTLQQSSQWVAPKMVAGRKKPPPERQQNITILTDTHGHHVLSTHCDRHHAKYFNLKQYSGSLTKQVPLLLPFYRCKTEARRVLAYPGLQS